jgi:hypothetical protein
MTKKRGVFEKVPGSGIWFIRFVDGRGRYRRERAGTYSFAIKLLDKRRGEAVQGKKLPETLRRKFVPFSEVAEDALIHSRTHKRSWQDDESRMKRLVQWWWGAVMRKELLRPRWNANSPTQHAMRSGHRRPSITIDHCSCSRTGKLDAQGK